MKHYVDFHANLLHFNSIPQTPPPKTENFRLANYILNFMAAIRRLAGEIPKAAVAAVFELVFVGVYGAGTADRIAASTLTG